MRIVIDSAIPFLKGLFEPYSEVIYRPGGDITADVVRSADALVVRTRTRCDAALLQGSSVSLVASATIGSDHIDLQWCRAHSIEVTTAAGCNSRGVLQWLSAVLCHLSQRQRWHPSERTIGVVGVGNIGSIVERYAKEWGFRVLCCDPPRQKREGGEYVSLDYLLQNSDIVTLHTPLDSTTRHLINSDTLSQLKDEATIINSSRGEVVDGEALLLSPINYVLDVWEREPNINTELLERSVLATPHIAGYTLQGKANASADVVNVVARHLSIPLLGWYPSQVQRSAPKDISWQELCATIGKYFDVEAQSCQLKQNRHLFEDIRDNYIYRNEYF